MPLLETYLVMAVASAEYVGRISAAQVSARASGVAGGEKDFQSSASGRRFRLLVLSTRAGQRRRMGHPADKGDPREARGRHALDPCRRARSEWWGGTGLNRARHKPPGLHGR